MVMRLESESEDRRVSISCTATSFKVKVPRDKRPALGIVKVEGELFFLSTMKISRVAADICLNDPKDPTTQDSERRVSVPHSQLPIILPPSPCCSSPRPSSSISTPSPSPTSTSTSSSQRANQLKTDELRWQSVRLGSPPLKKDLGPSFNFKSRSGLVVWG